jgi:hypothetical protein
MTERGLPSVDSAPACPFVAFEDDREARSTSPDHRHRCYAELVPLPRASAHQEAYCLSSAFPVCPTFQDWARREAAHARGEGDRPRAAPKAQPESAERTAAANLPGAERVLEGDKPRRVPAGEPPILRNPPRDWAAPPPWASGGAGSAGAKRRASSGDPPGSPDFLADRADESRGLAGSAADRLAAGSASSSDDSATSPYDAAASGAPDEELASLVAGRPVIERPVRDYPPPGRSTRRPSVSSTRPAHREREAEAIVGPAWERARRYEAYPTIRTRAGLPSLPRLVVLTAALAIAALALFFLPALLGVGSGGGPDTATARPSASQGIASASLAPTAPPAPTPQVYVIKSGDTMSKIATIFGLTPDELCAANKETVTDCDKIKVGAELIIPAKPQDEFTEPSAGSSAEPS